MIGFGYDGTNANIAEEGFKGLLKREVPWALCFGAFLIVLIFH